MAYNITLCQAAFNNVYDLGNFDVKTDAMQYHDPTRTFYMEMTGGDRGTQCENTPRKTDIFVYCGGCPSGYECKNLDTNAADGALFFHPCACAVWTEGCVTQAHLSVTCPAGVPHYRKGFDVYDASTGIAADISKVVVKDGEPLPAWKDISTPEVSGSRAVIPSSSRKAVFYMMMAQGETESTSFDKPDVFTSQPNILEIEASGSGVLGGTVSPNHMERLDLKFKCLALGLASVHVEIPFGGQFYPSDFAFTYECESIDGGWSPFGTFIFTIVFFGGIGCCAMAGYNYGTLGKRGRDIIPFVDYLQPAAEKLLELARSLIAMASSRLSGAGSSTSSSTDGYATVSGTDTDAGGYQQDDSSFKGII